MKVNGNPVKKRGSLTINAGRVLGARRQIANSQDYSEDFNTGVAAFRAGVEFGDNPHNPLKSAGRYNAWATGWKSAKVIHQHEKSSVA